MDNLFLEFLEAYKSLDEVCKQILKSDKGISKYIEEMDNDSYGRRYVMCWEEDYKKLKNMRWIRNRLVHEVDSFNDYIITYDDVEWLKNFRARIISCTDPFSILNQTINEIKKKQEEKSTNSNRIDTRMNTNKYITIDRKIHNKKIKDITICLLIIIVFLFISILLYQI